MDMWMDTNVIIRFLTNDHAEHSVAANRLISQAYNGKYTLWVHNLVVAECCYVLESSHYGYARNIIADHLTKLLKIKGIKPETPLIFKALELYAKHNIDYEDAFLSSISSGNRSIVSFNTKDFAKCGCECYNPIMLEEE